MSRSSSFFYLKDKKQFLHCYNPVKSILYFRDFSIDLLTGEKSELGIWSFIDDLSELKVGDDFVTPDVFHLYYDLGHLFVGDKDSLPAQKPLAIHIKYRSTKILDELPFKDPGPLTLVPTQIPSKKDYKKGFFKIREHLLAGDCYQVNYTSDFYYNFSSEYNYEDFIAKLWTDKDKIGAYGHCTYIDSMERLIFSNSPECLFQLKRVREMKNYIMVMPIKGTVERDPLNYKEAWKRLSSSKKEQAELYMITDLLRNDLAKIDNRPAKVILKKVPLKVPGLLHQYSVVGKPLSKSITYYGILKSIFPGGSVTGAPKKRVMQIISSCEERERKIYCGSTLILHKTLRSASINIRTANVDFTQNELCYGSGGGVTLLSEWEKEFEEMFLKMRSFLQLFV